MSNTLREHGADSLRRELLGHSPEKNTWTLQYCLTQYLAQDLRAFRIINEHAIETYSGLLAGTNKDAQSDAGREMLRASTSLPWDLVLEALHSHKANAWGFAQGSQKTQLFLDLDIEPLTTTTEEQTYIIDENAEEWTSDRLTDELHKFDIEDDWPRLRELVLTAEDTNFSVKQSKLVAPALLMLATQYRDSDDPKDKPAVYSAIRTGASMLRPNESGCLLKLLAPGHPIDTSLVTLKMLGRIFEAQPPTKLNQHSDLTAKVGEIAKLLLNPYAIGNSQTAAMGQLAVYALAAMASDETLPIVQDVRRIGVSWFTQQTARELHELRSSWDARSAPAAPEVLELLDRAIQELSTT